MSAETVATIKELHRTVWRWRREVMEPNTKWKTPEPLDALRFASQEINEAIDALYTRSAGYARNNERNIDVELEVGQCVIMLLTALPELTVPQENILRIGASWIAEPMLEHANFNIAAALLDCRFGYGPDYYCISIFFVLEELAQMFDLSAITLAAMKQLEEKHLIKGEAK